jgi:hypothetical protein
MRETEILRGLTKAKQATMPAYADGMVPHRPTVGERFVGKLTGGLLGYKEPPKPAAPAVEPAVTTERPTGLRKTAMTLGNRKNQIDQALKDAGAYAEGMVPFIDDEGIINGPGTGTSDSVTARVSDDEAILPAKTVEAVGSNNIARLIEATNDGKVPKRGLGVAAEYADGFVSNALEKTKRGFGAAKEAIFPTPTNPVTSIGKDAAAPAASGRVAGTTPTPNATPSTISKTAKFGLGAAKKLAAPLAIGAEVNQVGGTVLDPDKPASTKLRAGAESATRLGTAAAGAAFGAQVGTFGGPLAPITVPLGTVIGGAAGYYGADKLLEKANEDLGQEDANAGSPTLLERVNSQPTTPSSAAAPSTGTIASAIDTAPAPTRGLTRARDTVQVASDPFTESRELLAEAARADNTGTLSGQIRSANLRRQSEALTDIADKSAQNQDRMYDNANTAAGNSLQAQLNMAANARAEVEGDQKRAEAFDKRLTRFLPDTEVDGVKVDNSAKRAELYTMLEATMAKLPPEEQQKLINPATGQMRGVEALDPKLAERLLFNAKVRDRVQEAGNGLGNRLTGNQAGDLSDNLLDYDIATATKKGDFYVFPNGAKISENDFRYLEGQADTFVPNFIQDIYNTPTSNFKTRAQQNGR